MIYFLGYFPKKSVLQSFHRGSTSHAEIKRNKIFKLKLLELLKSVCSVYLDLGFYLCQVENCKNRERKIQGDYLKPSMRSTEVA